MPHLFVHRGLARARFTGLIALAVFTFSCSQSSSRGGGGGARQPNAVPTVVTNPTAGTPGSPQNPTNLPVDLSEANLPAYLFKHADMASIGAWVQPYQTPPEPDTPDNTPQETRFES